MSNFSCCKAIQVYDEEEGKVVDIPKEEVEAVQNSRRIYFVIERNYSEARKNGISNQEFLTGLLRFAVAGLESNVRQSPELDKKVQEKRILGFPSRYSYQQTQCSTGNQGHGNRTSSC